MTEEELKLYNELKKLVKRANQRIYRLEKETKMKAPFEVKQLYDYIDNFAITKKGKVKLSQNYSLMQMKVVQKAVEDFLKKDMAKIRSIKNYKKQLEKEIGKKLSYSQANIFYQSGKHYSWIYEHIPKSEFWGEWVARSNMEHWTRNRWIEEISDRIGRIPDEELKQDLIALYIYIKE